MNTARSLILVFMALALVACASAAERKAEEERKLKLADTYTQLGVSYLQRGQLDVALENLSKAIELNPDNPQINNMMALLRWRLKEYDEAEKHFRKALEEGKGDPGAWNNYGVFLCERGRYDAADDAFKHALANPLYNTPAEANVNAGMCQMRKPSPTSAEKYFRTALEINPRQPRVLIEMAKLSYSSGRTLPARAFLQRYSEVGEDTAEVLLLKAKVEGALGNRDAEASYAMRLRGKFPDSPEVAQLNKTEKNAGAKSSGKVQR